MSLIAIAAPHRELMWAMQNRLEELALRYLDTTKPYGGQKPSAIFHTMSQITAEYDFLDAYPGAWPAQSILQSYLACTTQNNGRKFFHRPLKDGVGELIKIGIPINITKIVDVVKKTLDTKKRYQHQTIEAVDAFFTQAIIACPILLRCEGAWPARSIAISHLAYTVLFYRATPPRGRSVFYLTGRDERIHQTPPPTLASMVTHRRQVISGSQIFRREIRGIFFSTQSASPRVTSIPTTIEHRGRHAHRFPLVEAVFEDGPSQPWVHDFTLQVQHRRKTARFQVFLKRGCRLPPNPTFADVAGSVLVMRLSAHGGYVVNIQARDKRLVEAALNRCAMYIDRFQSATRTRIPDIVVLS
ncbi:hypothetical protein C8F01DRAFT_1348902 [Mycena amicta]|nr:hypothetical protein C8F01DRAFT_1348902 [Mycena amicta]